jgi:UDP-N-acetylmuramoyl-tripeptide--D-alanyl-D-alanine ligase
MGAYKKGEIKKLASIVEPQIGVITGVEPQHLSLFGSLDDIKKAKFESIEALPKNGIAIFNLSNKYCRKLAERAKKLGLKVLTYYRKKDKEKENADIVVEPILVNEDGIEFEIYFAKGKRELFAPLHGVHFLENLACAILVARHFRISWKEIESACKTIETPESTMRIYKAGKGIIIDDSYNNTPHGFLAAVEYLKYFKGYRKYVITSGIIELGKEEGRVHRKLAGKMSREVDKIILTKSDARVALESGLEKNKNKLKLVRGSDQILKFIQSFSNSKCVILLEGRMPSVVSEYVHELSKDSKNVS